MPSKKLTDLTVQKLKPPAKGQVDYFDTITPNFGLRVSAGGRKSFTVFYRHYGRLRRMTLGRYPELSLVAARRRARKVLEQVAEDMDPATIKAERTATGSNTVSAVVARFIEQHAKARNKSWHETERIFSHDILPVWGHRPIESIKRREVIELLDRIVARGSPLMANRVLSAVRKLFNWALEKGIIEATPITGIKAPSGERDRDRILSDDEIVAFWNGCDRMSYPFGPLFQLLLVTGQRLGEAADICRDDLDMAKKLWIIPREKTKSDRVHSIPLSPMAMDIIETLPVFEGGYLFSTTGGQKPVSGFSKAKARLDMFSGVADWRLHDLRRTAASGMASLKTPVNVLSKVLNHAGGQGGVTAIYNRHGYDDEKREALGRWSDKLLSIIPKDKASQAA